MASFLEQHDDSLQWLLPYLPYESEEEKRIAKVEFNLEALNNAGGLSAAMKVLNVKIGERSLCYIYKTVPTQNLPTSKKSGGYREGLFYNSFAKHFHAMEIGLPGILYSSADPETGNKIIIMEDLSTKGIQSGYFFGPGSPLNWGKNLAEETAKIHASVPVTAKDVAIESFNAVAKMHRWYWGDKGLYEYRWLAGVNRYSPSSEEDNGYTMWNEQQQMVANMWNMTKTKMANSADHGFEFNEFMINCVEASLAKADWQTYLTKDLPSRHWTLIHGDFHPANIYWMSPKATDSDIASRKATIGEPYFMDFEVFGLGTGPQDIAQYLISHMNPETRRECEAELMSVYYETLTTPLAHETNSNCDGRVLPSKESYPFEEFKKDYVNGGAERWIWLFALLTVYCPPKMTNYFHDQLYEFMKDHGVTAENIGMPRC